MDDRRPDGFPETAVRADNHTADEAKEDGILIESRNPAMTALLETVQRAAAGDSTILLTGESGTGKDVLARQIHRWSPRRHRPFVVINCGSLSEPLLENEMFGHVRGTSTGAVDDKPGRLEAGGGGTMLFDEIADLSTSLQAKFLCFVQDRSFGSSRALTVDVRVVAATNRNLEAEVAAGRFRKDLYYRLNVITFTLPPLRERTQDIMVFADWMLKEISNIVARRELRIAPDAAEALFNYRWPGNIRELHNALLRAAALARSETITFADLPDSIRYPVSSMSVPGAHGIRLKDFEREHIIRVLAESPTLGQAAATLGINVTTLWRKRRHYGISRG